MPHQTTDRDFPQEDNSTHAQIVEETLSTVEMQNAKKVLEIARMVTNHQYSEIVFRAAVQAAFPSRRFYWS